ncbi:polysaccharide deacetylase family protein [Streptomyces sp. NBC_00140]|uniref:polysaccharide deacetylase family protein n=1 Tax=Streptomyces sp. NBC_00140 TaxID=2975664 RepID=UPI00224F4EAA|nr:polysaccharide deacetylase family protein [Streptomyces sp. NBC_00140]MCX5328563.1 polysaccharide deacetylase family protein [Streptomyces sp. NBC_00140]
MSDALVLMYHAIGTRSTSRDPHNLFVSPESLRRQLGTLLDRGWTPLTLDRYLGGDVPRRSVLLTFDDGYQAFLDEGLPVLRELDVPATVFVLSGLLGGRSGWMADMPDEPLVDADGVRELVGAGLDVECHGWDHSHLAGTDPRTLARNVTHALRTLADLTGRRPRAFAYPYGDHDAAARRAVADAGFEIGFSVHQRAGRFAVPRVDVTSVDTDTTFLMKTRPGYTALRQMTGRVPGLRPALHSLVGRAKRSST